MKFYTIEEVAEMLKVSDKTVRRLIEGKKLDAVKVGTVYRISEEDLKKYLEENKV